MVGGHGRRACMPYEHANEKSSAVSGTAAPRSPPNEGRGAAPSAALAEHDDGGRGASGSRATKPLRTAFISSHAAGGSGSVYGLTVFPARFSLAEILVLAGAARADRMAPPTSLGYLLGANGLGT